MIGLTTAVHLAERGMLPDGLCRQGIRRLIALRIREEETQTAEEERTKLERLLAQLRSSPVAIHPEKNPAVLACRFEG